MGKFPKIPEAKKLNFKFKKEGFKKLLIFDLDETLIHSLRDQDENEEEFIYACGEESKMPKEMLQWVDITEPSTGETEKIGFYVRPFVQECLRAVNSEYEVAIFTVGTDWYADPIIEMLDPDGTLIQHRFFR